MRTIELNIFEFSELSEESKANAIEKLSDINVDYDWWDCTYEDAKMIAIDIKGFDIGRGSYCEIEVDDCQDSAKLIIVNHGECCNSFKSAKDFLETSAKLTNLLDEDEDNEYKIEAIEELLESLEDVFKKELSEYYLNDLRVDYDYRLSDEAVIEAIENNNYEFLENGEMR